MIAEKLCNEDVTICQPRKHRSAIDSAIYCMRFKAKRLKNYDFQE
jgi:hypothetical protein